MSASPLTFCVIATEVDGTVTAWGPFSGHRADQAATALLMLSDFENVQVRPLLSGARLAEEIPDWRRVVA